MSVPVNLRGTNPHKKVGNVEQQMHQRNGYGSGAIVYNADIYDFNPEFQPFLNEDLGNNMAQDVSFGGTPELIFDGGSGGTEWAGSGDAEWDFSDGGKVVLDHGADNSTALFQDAGTVDSSAHSALTGKIDLDNYTPSTQNIIFRFGIAGSPLGDPIGINSYIDTGDFSEQSFVIPLADFNLAGAIVDEFTMTVERSAGHNPHVKFDDFQIEETGTPLTYTVQAEKGVRYFVRRIIIIASAPLDTTLTDNSMPKLSGSNFLGISMPNGLVLQNIRNRKVGFSGSFRQLSDFLYVGLKIIHPPINDGTNTLIYLEADFDNKPIILDGSTDDKLTFTINDDLSSFVELRASVRGFVELDSDNE